LTIKFFGGLPLPLPFPLFGVGDCIDDIADDADDPNCTDDFADGTDDPDGLDGTDVSLNNKHLLLGPLDLEVLEDLDI
ncbi:3457_t:CDS:2, partial [Funneliformis mosseae]